MKLGLATVALLAVGCAPALSSFTPAHVAPRKHVQAELGFDVSVPTGTITDARAVAARHLSPAWGSYDDTEVTHQ